MRYETQKIGDSRERVGKGIKKLPEITDFIARSSDLPIEHIGDLTDYKHQPENIHSPSRTDRKPCWKKENDKKNRR